MASRCAHNYIAIGASAGGVAALKRLFGGLPGDLDAALFVVLHTTPNGNSVLPEILNQAGPLRARFATVEEPIIAGRVYVAPPNRHLELTDGKVILTTAPKENHTRPAINPLFRSAAMAQGRRVVGVILTGILDDGTAGLWEIKRRGGIAVVQSPEDAAHPQMPKSAIANVEVDYTVPLSKMAELLASLCECEVRR